MHIFHWKIHFSINKYIKFDNPIRKYYQKIYVVENKSLLFFKIKLIHHVTGKMVLSIHYWGNCINLNWVFFSTAKLIRNLFFKITRVWENTKQVHVLKIWKLMKVDVTVVTFFFNTCFCVYSNYIEFSNKIWCCKLCLVYKFQNVVNIYVC